MVCSSKRELLRVDPKDSREACNRAALQIGIFRNLGLEGHEQLGDSLNSVFRQHR